MFAIDPMSRIPIYQQIIEQTEKFIMAKALKAGDKIPSIRTLSMELSINPITILKAYSDMDARELVHSVPGKGYYVSDKAYDILISGKASLFDKMNDICIKLALSGIPESAIIDCIKKIYTDLPNAEVNNNDKS